jgi:tetratricopeptide (TPR) repeat protein
MLRFKSFTLFVISLSALSLLVMSQAPEDYFNSSIEQLGRGEYETALASINKAIAMDSLNAEYYLQRAIVYYHLTRYDKVIKDCYTALKIEPDKPQVYFLRGQVCLVTESYGGAILFFGKAVKYAKNSELLYNAFLNRGQAYLAIGKYSEAHDDYIAAYEINPLGIDVLIPLSNIYFKLKQYKEALLIIDQLLKIKADYAEAYELLAKITFESKDYNKAIEAIKKYSTYKPNDNTAFNFLAEIYLQMSDYDNALVAVNRSISICPSDPAPFKIKGLVYFAKGQAEEGCNNLFRAMQMGYFEKYGYDLLEVYQEKCEKE